MEEECRWSDGVEADFCCERLTDTRTDRQTVSNAKIEDESYYVVAHRTCVHCSHQGLKLCVFGHKVCS